MLWQKNNVHTSAKNVLFFILNVITVIICQFIKKSMSSLSYLKFAYYKLKITNFFYLTMIFGYLLMYSLTSARMFSVVKPNFSSSTLNGADAPNRSRP